MTFLSKFFLISLIFNLLQIIKPQFINEALYFDIEGDIECREDIPEFGEFSFLLQDVKTTHGDSDDHLGSTKTDRYGHFHFNLKLEKKREYENWTGLEPYFLIEHICYTPSVKGILRMDRLTKEGSQLIKNTTELK
ncbi:hypothetical protein Mgra_00007266, partial [Meloidogyne graminicola]